MIFSEDNTDASGAVAGMPYGHKGSIMILDDVTRKQAEKQEIMMIEDIRIVEMDGFLTLAGGIIITFTKEILNLIVG